MSLKVAIDEVFETADALLSAGRYQEIDDMLRRLDLDSLDPTLMVAHVVATIAAAEHLKERAAFVERVQKWMFGTLKIDMQLAERLREGLV